jgi:hypothetical protein
VTPKAHELRLEAALAVARRADLHRALLGLQRLRRRPVAGVTGPAGRLLVRLVAEMPGQLRRQGALHQPLRQLREHPARPDDLLLSPGTGKQLIDHLVRQLLAKLERELDRRRSADRLLRAPSGLAPHPAGAIGQNGLRLGLRRHDAPFSSCLHRASDTPDPVAGRVDLDELCDAGKEVVQRVRAGNSMRLC